MSREILNVHLEAYDCLSRPSNLCKKTLNYRNVLTLVFTFGFIEKEHVQASTLRQDFLLCLQKKKNPREYFTFLNIRDGTEEEYFLSADLFQECKRKSRRAKLQFTIKKGSSFNAFEYLNKGEGGAGG